MQSPFRRKADAVIESVEETSPVSVAGTRTRAYTPSKREQGVATPKRKQGGRVAEPPPANRREALKRMREKDREARAERREGMLTGKEEFLPARDRGPERGLVRDIVDSRRNLGSWFFGGALVVIVLSSGAMPLYIQVGANMFWIFLAVAVAVDSFLLTRRVKKVFAAKLPKSAARGHYFYAVMRAFQFRRLRMPSPRVKIGEAS